MRTLSRFGVLVLAAGSFWAVAAAVESEPARLPAPTATPGPRYHDTTIARGEVLGNMSCAAASCHGADVPSWQAGGELHTFADADPHRRAYQVLFNERSKRMVKLLNYTTPAHQSAVCLKCHGATPPNADHELAAASVAHRLGANCENCHGAASQWLTLHYTAPWKILSPEEKAGFGFLPTKDLSYRATLCAGCHVGEPNREVDHQLIAAGHPALRFELAAYQLPPIYTKHWTEKNYGPDVEAWTWLIGQVGTAKAGAELLRHRAAEAALPNSKRDWPELAEYTCFSCHQEIGRFTLSDTIPAPRPGSPRPGTLPWGSWLYPLTLDLSKNHWAEWTGPKQASTGLTELAELFRKTDRPQPKLAADQAKKAVNDLDGWLTELQSAAESRSSGPLSPGALRAALTHAIRFAGTVPQTNADSTDWDRYTQGFLAVAALYRALIAVDPSTRLPEVEDDLREIASLLRFPKGQDSPAEPEDRAGAIQKHWKKVIESPLGIGPGSSVRR